MLELKEINEKVKLKELKDLLESKINSELTPSRWIERNIETDIITYDYLSLFKILEYKEHEIITFHTKKDLPPPDDNNLYENNRDNQYQNDNLIVKIEATRALIRKRKFKKKNK